MAQTNPGKPFITHIANLGSLRDTPTAKKPWPLDKKIAAVADAGFDGFIDQATSKHGKLAEKFGLKFVGAFTSSKPDEFRALLQQQKDAGAAHVSIRLGEHDTNAGDAVRMALRAALEGDALGLKVSVETHRGSCTETPEKTYALADGYQRVTAKPLIFAWDFSHIAVVKNLAPSSPERLLARSDLIQVASLFRCRPFNSHHCQVSVTDGRGRVSPELEDWLPFAKKSFQAWLGGNQAGRELIAISEMGSVSSGFNLHPLPDSWSDAVKLRGILDKLWKSLPGVAK